MTLSPSAASTTAALYSLPMLNDRSIATVNTAQVADVCGNKLQTTSALTTAGILAAHADCVFVRQRAALSVVGVPGGAENAAVGS